MWKRISLALFILIAIAGSVGMAYMGYTSELFHPVIGISLFLGLLWGLIVSVTPLKFSHVLAVVAVGILLGYLAGLQGNSLSPENYFAFRTVSMFIVLPIVGGYLSSLMTSSFEIH